MSFEDYIADTIGGGLSRKKATVKKATRTAEDIMAEFMPLVEIDQRKGG